MARLVRIVAFRERSWLDVPLFTIPFLGDVSPRRLGYMAMGASAALALALATGAAGIYAAIAVVCGAIAGYTASRDTKAVIPEKQILAFITQSYAPKTKERPVAKKIGEEEVKLQLEPSEPVVIEGYVFDPMSGSPLAGAELTILVDGKEAGKTIADSKGKYRHYLLITPGTHIVEVQAGGRTILRRKVIVTLKKT